MPRRLVLAFADVTALSRRDPSSFVLAFAAWSALNGASLLLTHDTFAKSPVYSLVAQFQVDDNLVGATMVLDGLLLCYSIIAPSPAVRASIAYLSGIVWFLWGCLLGLGGWSVGLISSAALWIVLSAFWLMRSISAHPPGSGSPRAELHLQKVARPDQQFPPIHIDEEP